jgi:predicted restriction endonuclease
MQLGKLTCEFTDTDRKEVKHLRWNGKSISSSEAKVVITTEMPGAVERKGDSALRFGQRTLRPDQAAFRDEVMRVYGGECCLTGCAVPFALEAAHIAPFTDGGPDAAANGLLLRADLHALMDSGHLAIDPATRKVHFSPEARHWPEYARLHGRRRLRAPQAGYEDRAPGRKALALRWDAFKSITATF